MVAFVSSSLSDEADADRAVEMAAYMKTEMPFYGVNKPARADIFRGLKKAYVVSDGDAYGVLIRTLWDCEHREEKYLAVDLAKHFKKFITLEQLDLYEYMIRDGAWWDFVDDIAKNLIGKLLADHPGEMKATLRTWIHDDDMWIRRTAILAQLAFKEDTDAAMLFEFALARADETEFFIRKAIGWALRQYSYSDPDAVYHFALENKDVFSNLTFKEGTRILKKNGWDI